MQPPPHEKEICTRTLCANCSGEHSSLDKNCPRYTQMREILKIKTTEYCSLSEARRIYKEKNTTNHILNNTYASTLSQTPMKRKDPIRKSTPLNTETTSQLNYTHKDYTPLTTAKKPNEINPAPLNPKPTSKLTENKHKFANTIEETTQEKPATPTNNVNNIENCNLNISSYTSPISRLTQSLIENNNYFVPTDDEDNLDDTAINPAPPQL